MTIPQLFFAAGLGTRMGDLVRDRPKPLVRVAGLPLIDHALAFTDPRIGPKVVNLHYKAQMLRDHLAGREIVFSDETAALLETGGGLRQAMPLLGGSPVVTMNTDAVWRGDNPLTMLLDAWRDDMDALLLTVPRHAVTGHHGTSGFARDANGRISRSTGEVFTGLQMIRTDSLSDIPETAFSLNIVWDRMIARGTAYGISYTGQWCDVGQPSSIPLAEAMLDV